MTTSMVRSTASATLPGGLRYLEHSAVESIHLDDHAPRNPYATGYGGRIPTRYRLTLTDGRTRRVYAMRYGNAVSFYVHVDRRIAHLDTDTEHAIGQRVFEDAGLPQGGAS